MAVTASAPSKLRRQASLTNTLLFLLAALSPLCAAGESESPTSPIFKDVSKDVGLTLKHADSRNACWVDFNGDGWADLVAHGQLWINHEGRSFSRGPGGRVGRVVAADFDNDGWADLFSWSRLKLFRNIGGTGLSEVELPAFPGGRIGDVPYGYTAGSACWGDFNHDGWVDIYVSGYESWDKDFKKSTTHPDLLLMSVNGAAFRQVVVDTAYRGRGVSACDFDQDGDLDLYVSNYRLQPNRLWRNDGSGNLTDAASALNAVGASPGFTGGHSIGACWGDFSNSGLFDLFVGNFAHQDTRGDQPKSRFLRNQGPEQEWRFEDKGACGVFYQESYASPAAADFDNDGRLDLFFTTVYNPASFGRKNHPVLFRNKGRFEFARATHSGLEHLPPTYQAAWADYDHDGRLDLMTASALFKNQGPSENWLKVRLQGDGKIVNRSAIGAQVRVALDGQMLTRQVEAGTGQGNQNDVTLHFGLGNTVSPVSVKITWPDRSVQMLDGIKVNQLVSATFKDERRRVEE